MAEQSRVVIDKLNNSNYQTWKYKTELLLVKEDLWDVVNEEPPEPASQKWKQKDGKARAIIGLLLEDNQLGHVRKLRTAKETWDKLKDYHEKSTLSRKVSFLKRLCNLRLDENGQMDDHLSKMEDIVDQLSALGESFAEPLLVAFMLSSLPENYATLITALETRPEADLTVELVKNKLLEEFARRNESKQFQNENEYKALKSETSCNSTSISEQKNKVKSLACFFCKKLGHVKADCRKYEKWKRNKEKKQQANLANNASSTKEINYEQNEHFCFTNVTDSHKFWCIDSGATTHMCNDKTLFVNIDYSASENVKLANGNVVVSKGKGDCLLNWCWENGKEITVTVKDVLYIPQLAGNLLSVKKLADKGYEVKFKGVDCFIMKGDVEVGRGVCIAGLYVLKESKIALRTVQLHANCIHDWHIKLGHRNPADILKMSKDSMAENMKIAPCSVKLTCEDCIATKACREPFPQKSFSKTSETLDLLHTDLCGPMQTQTPGGARYVLTVIDDFSRFCTIYLQKCKDETLRNISHFIKQSQTQFGKTPKRLRSDRGGEYVDKNFEKLLKDNGIIHEMTVAYTPQQNGIAERKNRSLIEMTRAMLKGANLPFKYWGEGVVTANYLQNRLPTKELDVTPYERWYKRKPSLENIQAFGTPAYVHVPHEKRRKLDDTAVKRIMVGYEEGTKGYRLLDTSTDKILISRDVTFMPKDPHHGKVIHSDSDQPISEELKAENKSEVVLPRRSDRQNKGVPPTRMNIASFKAQSQTKDPTNYHEACSGADAEKWRKAMEDEIKALKGNGTWVLTKTPEDKSVIGCKWVYKTKTDSEGNISRYKARLVAQGYQQKYGHDYDEVFAPVAKPTTLRMLLTIAGKRKMTVKHYDIQSAYLNGDLAHEVYMKQPPGYHEGDEDTVCKLVKNLYGLKQGANEWNRKFNDVLLEKGFQRSQNDPCLYSRNAENNWLYLVVHVDDIVIASSFEDMLVSFENEIAENFVMKNLGYLQYYLGIQFERDADGIFYMNQSTYILKKLKQHNLNDCKTSNVPMDPGYFKQNNDSKSFDKEIYKSAIGSLLYLAVNTRPDIAVAVSILARKVSDPTEKDWNEVKRVFKYLKKTKDLKLRLGKIADQKDDLLKCFVDADWAGDPTDRKSNTGYFFTYYGSLLTWMSRKQTCVALSSTEAEFVALAEAAKEAIWLKRLLLDFGEKDSDCIFFEDNQSCINMLSNEKDSGRTKHIDTRYHFVKELIKENTFEIQYLPTEEMTADILTKPLGTVKVKKFSDNLGLC